jgi:hypothetical protein
MELLLALVFVLLLLSRPQLQQPKPPGNGDTPSTTPFTFFAFNGEQVRFFTERHPEFLHPGDAVILVSGNWTAPVNPGEVNQWARQLRAVVPHMEIHCATMGLDDVKMAARDVDPSLVKSIMWIWEPTTVNNTNPDWPEMGFPGGINNRTRRLFQQAGPIVRNAGFEFWSKPTGRIVHPRGGEGEIDVGMLIDLCDGINFQLQDHYQQGNYAVGLDWLIDKYQSRGVAGVKGLYAQITVHSEAINGVNGATGFACAQVAWSKRPAVTAPSLWWALRRDDQILDVMQRREALRQPVETPAVG